MTQTQDILSYRGQNLTSADGDKIVTIEEIYLDTETNAPKWALVNTGLFGTKSTFVPIKDATTGDDGASVPFDKDTVKNAPKVDLDGEPSQREEAELYRHYGLEYTESRSDTGLPEGGAGSGTATGTAGTAGVGNGETRGRDVSGPTTDDAMTRSEEELRVGTTERETGRVRLRKYVLEDEVTQTVPVRRETARLEREPITDANVDDAMSGPEISEEEHEVVLREEEPVVEKRGRAEGARAARQGRHDPAAGGSRGGPQREGRSRGQWGPAGPPGVEY